MPNDVLEYPYTVQEDKRRKLTEALPLIPVSFIGENGRVDAQALLDSGADTIIIPLELAKSLGIRLKKLSETIRGVGGETDGYEGYVFFELGRGARKRVYGEIIVRACDFKAILVGRKPVFEDYKVEFQQFDNKLILTPKEILSDKK